MVGFGLAASAPAFRFGSAPFRAALQTRLGLPVTAIAGRARCRCGHLTGPHGHHALSCNPDGMTFRRHQAVLRALERRDLQSGVVPLSSGYQQPFAHQSNLGQSRVEYLARGRHISEIRHGFFHEIRQEALGPLLDEA